MITKQSLKNLKKKPTFRNAPRRRKQKIGRSLEITTLGGQIVEKRIHDGTHWVDIANNTSIETVLLFQIRRLQAEVARLKKGKK